VRPLLLRGREPAQHRARSIHGAGSAARSVPWDWRGTTLPDVCQSPALLGQHAGAPRGCGAHLHHPVERDERGVRGPAQEADGGRALVVDAQLRGNGAHLPGLPRSAGGECAPSTRAKSSPHLTVDARGASAAPGGCAPGGVAEKGAGASAGRAGGKGRRCMRQGPHWAGLRVRLHGELGRRGSHRRLRAAWWGDVCVTFCRCCCRCRHAACRAAWACRPSRVRW